ncbi:N-acetyltransferase family protein [Jatrophihabitans sp. YIM 134969]
MADASVRPATLVDVADVARLQVSTWRTAYAEILPAEVLEGLSEAQAAGAWQAGIAAPPTQGHRVLVAFEGRQAVGFVAMAPATSDDLDLGDATPAGDVPPEGGTVVVGPLLVEPRWGRRGHGSRLLAAAVDLAREDGAVRALAWVLEPDSASRAFFAAAGWEADGVARILDTGPTTLRELRLHADISA